MAGRRTSSSTGRTSRGLTCKQSHKSTAGGRERFGWASFRPIHLYPSWLSSINHRSCVVDRYCCRCSYYEYQLATVVVGVVGIVVVVIFLPPKSPKRGFELCAACGGGIRVILVVGVCSRYQVDIVVVVVVSNRLAHR